MKRAEFHVLHLNNDCFRLECSHRLPKFCLLPSGYKNLPWWLFQHAEGSFTILKEWKLPENIVFSPFSPMNANLFRPRMTLTLSEPLAISRCVHLNSTMWLKKKKQSTGNLVSEIYIFRQTEALASVLLFVFVIFSHYKHP